MLFKDEVAEAIGVLESGNWTMGEKCAQFETSFAEYIGAKHAIFVNSGSTANLLMMSVLQEQGYHGEIIVPALTWSTGIWPVIQNGFTPVLVDCDENLQLNVDKIEEAITGKTVAIFLAHIMGSACDMDRIGDIAEKYQLIVIEDACEALGADYEGQKVGTFGMMGSYSFYYSHHITTIEGGMIVTNNDDVADMLLSMRAHGWTRDMHDRSIEWDYKNINPKFLFAHMGYSVRPTEIQGAFGIHQLKKLNGYNEQRRQNHAELSVALENYPVEIIEPTKGAAPFGFVFLTEDRDRLSKLFDENNVHNRPVVAGNMARHPAMKSQNYKAGDLSLADEVMEYGIYLECFNPDIELIKILFEYFFHEDVQCVH